LNRYTAYETACSRFSKKPRRQPGLFGFCDLVKPR
jgi:hypothetical protein